MLSRLVRQIESALIDKLNDLSPGQSLSSERQIATELQVSRRTLRKALSSLETKGLIRRITGKGTFPTQGHQAIPIFQQRARMIGIISTHPFSKRHYLRRITVGAFEEAARHGYNLVFAKKERSENIFQILDDPHVDGLVLFEASRNQELIRELIGRKKPLSLIGYPSTMENVDSVQVDLKKAILLSLRHLYKEGHRRIAFILAADPEQNLLRRSNYEAIMRQLKIFVSSEWIVHPTISESPDVAVEKATSRLISLPPSKRPTALVIASSWMAYSAMRIILKRGMGIPQDISVVGLSNKGTRPMEEWEKWMLKMPKLTQVISDPSELGATAVNQLLERIKKPNLPRRNTLIPVHLEINQTTGRI